MRAGILFCLWLAILATSLAVSGGDTDNEVALPGDFLGVWKTAAPKYQDSFFEISERRLVFGTGGDFRDIHDIDRATATLRGDRRRILYTIWYQTAEDEDASQPFRFYYNSEQRVLRLENQQDIVWHNIRPGQAPDLMQMVSEIEEAIARFEERYGTWHRSLDWGEQ